MAGMTLKVAGAAYGDLLDWKIKSHDGLVTFEDMFAVSAKTTMAARAVFSAAKVAEVFAAEGETRKTDLERIGWKVYSSETSVNLHSMVGEVLSLKAADAIDIVPSKVQTLLANAVRTIKTDAVRDWIAQCQESGETAQILLDCIRADVNSANAAAAADKAAREIKAAEDAAAAAEDAAKVLAGLVNPETSTTVEVVVPVVAEVAAAAEVAEVAEVAAEDNGPTSADLLAVIQRALDLLAAGAPVTSEVRAGIDMLADMAAEVAEVA
jgi:hypothetical protein